MKEKLFRLHPFLFTLVPLLSIYTGARLIASPLQLLRPLLVLWGCLLILYPISRRLIGDDDWAGIFLSVFVFGFYFSKIHFVYIGIFLLVFIVAVVLCLRLLKQEIQVYKLSASLTVLGFVIAAFQIISLLIILRSIPFSYYQAMASRSKGLSLPLLNSAREKPDIYYIILDGYPRADVLEDIYKYDNSPFINELKGLGFVVPENSHSNYSRTAISVSTTLDMQYWDSISPNMEEAVFWWLVEPVMDHNRLRGTLETIGYQYVAIVSDWGITNNPSADIYLKPYPLILTDYENYYLSNTPLKLLYAPFQQFAPITTSEVHRDYIRYNLDALKRAPLMPSPKFVFSHIIVPHPPFVFEADGAPINSNGGFTFDSPDGSMFSKEEYKERYIGQVEYINRQIRQVIQILLDDSPIPPVIIIQADHGSAIYVDFNDLEGSCMKERFSTFAAYYLPGKTQDVIPRDISAVNIFRIVLNEYFDARLELLDNHQYFANGYYIFDFQDVTNRVNDPCAIPEDR